MTLKQTRTERTLKTLSSAIRLIAKYTVRGKTTPPTDPVEKKAYVNAQATIWRHSKKVQTNRNRRKAYKQYLKDNAVEIAAKKKIRTDAFQAILDARQVEKDAKKALIVERGRIRLENKALAKKRLEAREQKILDKIQSTADAKVLREQKRVEKKEVLKQEKLAEKTSKLVERAKALKLRDEKKKRTS